MTTIKGTHLTVRFSRVVDGDTVRVFLPNQDEDESLRILALDTEESFSTGGKPVTPWGLKAKARAEEFFAGAQEVTIEFPGNERVEECLRKYRGNFGRLLTFVHRDGVDFQEMMIREGYSPYFMKYGNAQFSGHHRRYVEAERQAQRDNLGVWDQLGVNGGEIRNYAALGAWWKLRARVIDDYRALKARVPSLLNTRLDYEVILEKAGAGEMATIFTEFRSIRRVGGDHGLISYGGEDRPFSVFIPNMESETGQQIVQLMRSRYISAGEDHPRRSYGYISGALSLFRDNPQMVVTSVDQVTDDLPAGIVPPICDEPTAEPRLEIAALLPNPEGRDMGHETVTLRNSGGADADLTGWRLQDRGNHRFELSGTIRAGDFRVFELPPRVMQLNNAGDEVFLFNAQGELQDHVSYTRQDAVSGQEIVFQP